MYFLYCFAVFSAFNEECQVRFLFRFSFVPFPPYFRQLEHQIYAWRVFALCLDQCPFLLLFSLASNFGISLPY